MIGLAIGAYGLTQALLQIPFGMLSDRIGRKPVLIGGLLIFAVGSVVAASAETIYGIIQGRFLQGSGAIAAVIIGGTVLKGGFGRVWGTVIGVLILSLIDNILNLTDFVSPYLNGAIQGVIIILAVILQRERRSSS